MCILLQWGKQASKLQLGYNLYTKNQKQNRKYKKKEKNKRKSRGTPCFGGALNMFCISSRTESSWMTQWSLQWRAFLKSSTSSLPSSNSPISGFFFFFLRGSLFLGGLGVDNDGILGALFWWTFREINYSARSALGGSTKSKPWSWRHVVMGI